MLRTVWRTAVILMLASASPAQPDAQDSRDLAVLQVVAEDYYPCEVPARLSLADATALPRAHSWASPSARQAVTLTPIDGTEPFNVDAALIASARLRNQKPLRTRGMSPARCSSETFASQRTVTLSRPGFSRDGSTALVAVTLEWLQNGYAAGYTVHLRRDGDVWRIDARGAEWIE
jgi:hypothetical protein